MASSDSQGCGPQLSYTHSQTLFWSTNQISRQLNVIWLSEFNAFTFQGFWSHCRCCTGEQTLFRVVVLKRDFTHAYTEKHLTFSMCRGAEEYRHHLFLQSVFESFTPTCHLKQEVSAQLHVIFQEIQQCNCHTAVLQTKWQLTSLILFYLGRQFPFGVFLLANSILYNDVIVFPYLYYSVFVVVLSTVLKWLELCVFVCTSVLNWYTTKENQGFLFPPKYCVQLWP